jgi:hypothetical protein
MNEHDSGDPGGPLLTGSRLSDLERLFELKRAGALTDEEFQAQKQRLIAENGAPRSSSPAPRSWRKWTIIAAFAAVAITSLIVALVWRPSKAGNAAMQEAVVSSEVASADPEVPPEAQPKSPSVRSLPPDEQRARAAQAALGSRRSAILSVNFDGSEERIEFSPKKLVWVGDVAILLSEGIVQDPGHASAGKIAAHYLRPIGDDFKLIRAYPTALVAGSFGQMSGWSVSDRFTSTPAIVAEGGGTWQGTTLSCMVIVELTRDGPREVASVPVSYSDSGSGLIPENEQTDLEGRATNVVRDREFTMRYTGTSSADRRYVRSGARFLRQGSQLIEACEDLD